MRRMHGVALHAMLSPRRSVPGLIRAKLARHPELARQVRWPEFITICEREELIVRVLHLPEGLRGRLIRGRRSSIHLSRDIPRHARAVVGMHELAHYWSDDPDETCFYEDESDKREVEDFCDCFGWWVTSSARVFVPGLREEDF